MRTLLVITLGIALAVVFDFVAAAINKRRVAGHIDGALVFIAAWLVFTLIDFVVGVASGHDALLEVVIHALVFSVPAALSWYLSRRRRQSRM